MFLPNELLEDQCATISHQLVHGAHILSMLNQLWCVVTQETCLVPRPLISLRVNGGGGGGGGILANFNFLLFYLWLKIANQSISSTYERTSSMYKQSEPLCHTTQLSQQQLFIEYDSQISSMPEFHSCVPTFDCGGTTPGFWCLAVEYNLGMCQACLDGIFNILSASSCHRQISCNGKMTSMY